MSFQLKQFRPLALIDVTHWKSACREVLGLEVLERNVRHLRKLGFEPAFVRRPPINSWEDRLPCFAWKGDESYLRLSGDYQYSSAFFSLLRTQIESSFNQSLQFETVDAKKCLTAWVVPGDANPRFYQLAACDVHEVSPDVEPVSQKLLEKHLLDEIRVNTEGWIARGLNKKISLPFSRLLVDFDVTPNQITLFNFVLGFLGCLLLLSLDWPLRIGGAFLLQVNSILDGCDGEVARLKVIRSRLGAWLDTITDDALNNLMFLCLALGLYRQFGNEELLVFSLATVGASLGVSGFIYHYLLKHNTQNAAHYRLSWSSPQKKSGETGWFDWIKPVLKRDFVIFAAFVLVIADLRIVLIAFLAPVWGAFFLYLASFIHAYRKTHGTKLFSRSL